MSERIFIQGAAGQIEIYQDCPQQVQGIAIVTHPHPLMGGNPKHKIPQLIAEVLLQKGYLVWRPSFRGMGQSEGEHDQGNGESQDIAQLSQIMQQRYAELPFYAAGFSFGAHVWAKAFHQLSPAERPTQLLLAGLPCGLVRGAVAYQTPALDTDLLLVHGADDDITPLSDVMTWAEAQRHPITIMPGANHFFTGYLKPLKTVIERYYR